MFYSTDARHERFWRVGIIARNAAFFHSFVASRARNFSSEKRGGAKDRLPKMSTKFAPRLRARAIWKLKSLKTVGVGALLEIELGKNCTTPARESNFCKKRHHAAWSEHFLKLSSAKFAPRLRARAIWKSTYVNMVKNWHARCIF